MQAYHQQIANLNLPNGASSLLIASPSQFAHMQQQHHHQNSYQELVKAYLPQLTTMSATGLASLSTSPASSSPSSSLSSSSSSSMASFAARLMSLNAHELKCLNSDNELMRHIHEAQVLIDNRLHDINSKSGTDQARQNKQQHLQSSPNQLNLNLALVQQHQEQQIHLQQQQHQQHILMSPDNYYQSYYAQQLALSQMAQFQQHQHHHQQQQQQQLLLMDSGYTVNSNKSANHHQNLSSVDARNDIGQQLNNLTNESSSLNSEGGGSNLERTNCNQQQHQMSVPALDLRTTPTRPVSDTPSPTSMRNRSGSMDGKNLRQQQQQQSKKAKLTEYRKIQQSADCNTELAGAQAVGPHTNQKHQLNNTNRYPDISNGMISTILTSNENFPDQADSKRSLELSLASKRVHQEDEHHHQDLVTLNPNIANTRSSRLQTNQKPGFGTCAAPITNVKKHKGEFDEPSPNEVAEREHQLSRPEHYHCRALELGTCACIIGSEFTTKTPREALEQLDQWRSLDIEQRIKWKWDLNDLPKDIPLCDIKKFEDLRRDFSNGRADFGGASKRKPLGIRGTRQFLLMLYCLWGHPGRDDPMQQDGYCPHCFAKIRTENEQSTLVRVVNHFNMKHRRGANPRLSPETRASTTPQDHLICETLKSVVETAVASTEGEPVRCKIEVG